MSHTVLVIIATLLMLPGILGIFIPVVPGIPYMFFVALLAGLLDRFAHITPRELGFLAVLALASFLVDHLSGAVGAKMGGASRKAVWYGFLGSIIGLFVLPPFGSIIGLFIGVIIGEVMQGRSHEKAVKAASASVLGSVAGMGINIILGLSFISLFIVFSIG